jgi:hypothetical protein
VHRASPIPRFLSALALLLSLALPLEAHEVPAEVRLDFWVLDTPEALEVYARVPVEALRDIALPLRGPGYLDLARAEAPLREGVELWLLDALTLRRDGDALPRGTLEALRVALPSDQRFLRSADALPAYFATPPLPETEAVFWEQAVVDIALRFLAGEGALSFQAPLGTLGLETHTRLRFQSRDGALQLFEFTGDPGAVDLNPGWGAATLRFIQSGMAHILGGVDHLLFLLCLMLPLLRLGPLLAVATAFTAAHSLTLIAAALELLPTAPWFPPLVETGIAASILFMALEHGLHPSPEPRWRLAFLFGLLHGFGFAFMLTDGLQFAGGHEVLALLAFNGGVELGQILVLLLAVPLLRALRERFPGRALDWVLIALVGHTALHWCLERGATVAAYDLTLPAFGALLSAGGLRWLALGLAAALVYALLASLAQRLAQARPQAL